MTEKHKLTANGTLSESLHRILADDIISGRLPPGIRLDEMSLAERFEVSRTPVRESLQHLVASGLAEKKPHRGVVVSRVTRDQMVGMFETMAELEAVCARLASERMRPDERRQLRELHVGSMNYASSSPARRILIPGS